MSIPVTPLVQATRAQWLATTDPITAGRLVYESDTGNYKIGDGVSTYLQLPYSSSQAGISHLILVELSDLLQPFNPSTLDPVQTINTLNTLSANYSNLTNTITALSATVNTNIASISTLNTIVGNLEGEVSASSTGLFFAGVWDSAANIPALESGVGTPGALYIATTANSNVRLDAITSIAIGDEIAFSATSRTWIKFANNSDQVQTVVGLVGNITAQQITAAQGLTALATAIPGGPGISVVNGQLKLNFGNTTGLVADGYALAQETTRATGVENNLSTELGALTTLVNTNNTTLTASVAAAAATANAAMPNTAAAFLALLNSAVTLLPLAPTPGVPGVWLDGNFFCYS